MQNTLQKQLSQLSQAQRERLIHIDFRLLFIGSINRSELESRFGIKGAAASRDLSLYKEYAPQNIEYDPQARAYIQRSGSFAPLFEYADTPSLAPLLYSFVGDFLMTQASFVCYETPTRLYYPDTNTLACITRAIHNKKGLDVSYYSFRSVKSNREIVPFAIIDSGLRWHVRGYDRKRKRFADFVINRIEEAKLIDDVIPESQSSAADIQWNRIADLHIAPHPKLEEHQKKAIQHEYKMTEGVLKLKIRASVVGYVLRHWNVDCSKDANLTERPEIQLWLKNRATLYGIENLMLAPGYEDENDGN